MLEHLSLILALASPVAAEAPPVVRVRCARGAVTRLVLAEPLYELRLSSAARAALGLEIEALSPRGVLRLAPRTPQAAVADVRGPRLRLRLALETGDEQPGRRHELHLLPAAGGLPPRVVERPAPAEAAAVAEPLRPTPPPVAAALPASPEATVQPEAAPGPATLGPAEPTPTPAPPVATAASGEPAAAAVPVTPTPQPSPSAPAVVFDVRSLMHATPVPIGRREGLPGQHPMTLVDALRDETRVWLRFTLHRGAAERVRAVTLDGDPAVLYTQEAVGRDLRVVVQLSRATARGRPRVALALASGAEYRFTLSSGTLADLWRKLFN